MLAFRSPSLVAATRTMRVTAKSGNTKVVKKENLPSKLCVVCQRPFTWRKKWERCWEEVKYCSKRCSGNKTSPGGGGGPQSDGDGED